MYARVSLDQKTEEKKRVNKQTNNNDETTKMISRQYNCHENRHCVHTYQVFLLPEKKEKKTLDHTLTRGYTKAREDLYKRKNGKKSKR
jgi:hypothetical protein